MARNRRGGRKAKLQQVGSSQGLSGNAPSGHQFAPAPLHFAQRRTGKAPVPQTKELAVQAYVRQSNYYYGRTPFEIGQGHDAQTYARFARHPIVKDALDRIISGVFWPKMSVSPVNDYKSNPQFEEIDNGVIAKIEQSFDDLDNETFNNVLKSLFRNALIYGYSIAEMVWEELDKGEWRLKAVKPKPSTNFGFETEENDDLLSLIYEITGEYIKGAKLDNFVVATWPYLEHGNFYGTSILNEVIYDLHQIEILGKLLLQGTTTSVKRKMVVHAVDSFKSKEEKAKNSAQIQSFASDADLIQVMAGEVEGKLSEKYKFDVLADQPSLTALEQINKAIEEATRRVKRTLGIPDNIGSTTANVASFAKDSSVEYDMFTATTSQGSQWVKGIVNRQLIPAIIKYNFPKLPASYKPPVWKVEEVEEQFQIDTVNYLKTAIDAGIISPHEPFVRELIGAPPKEEEDRFKEVIAAYLKEALATGTVSAEDPLIKLLLDALPPLTAGDKAPAADPSNTIPSPPQLALVSGGA